MASLPENNGVLSFCEHALRAVHEAAGSNLALVVCSGFLIGLPRRPQVLWDDVEKGYVDFEGTAYPDRLVLPHLFASLLRLILHPLTPGTDKGVAISVDTEGVLAG